MKYNHPIDFFSSPNSKFIGFSDIRHPQPDNNPQSMMPFQCPDEDRKVCRKLSFTASNLVDPIIPFGMDFFEEKLQECDEPQEYSVDQDPLEIHEDSLMLDAQFRASYPLLRSPYAKQTSLPCASHFMRMECEDIPEQPSNHQHQIQCKTESHQNELYSTPKRKPELFSARKSCDSTAEKSMSRSNEKGLRRLSSLAYSIVSQSTTTTYKEVAEKLLNHLNFNCTQIDDEDGTDRSSMQNVKRRVYDSLNVLLALGVIKRIGSKIARQKQRKPFTSEASPDLEKYNDMLAEYNQRVRALEARRKTEKELQEKLQIFRNTIDRNRKSKPIGKVKTIRLPFLAFMSNDEGEVEWLKKQTGTGTEKKKTGKRGQMREGERMKEQEDQCVRVSFREFPESYGDLDFFKLLQEQEEDCSGTLMSKYVQHSLAAGGSQKLQSVKQEMEYIRLKREQQMNLIDEVLGE